MILNNTDNQALLEINHLSVQFRTAQGLAHAVRDISIKINQGRSLAIVGESGSGKSVTAKAILNIHDKSSTVVSGSIRLDSKDLIGLDASSMRKIYGREVSIIFQDPLNSLNPLIKVGEQLAEVYRLQGLKGAAVQKLVIEKFRKVRIDNPESCYHLYPHELSGGMLQRIMILIATGADPKLLIADEPTTALDVTVQASILKLLQELQAESGMSLMLITHDIGIVAKIADYTAVMYAGGLMEYGSTKEILEKPFHPYTEGLLGSIPRPGLKRLNTIAGRPPELLEEIKGCSFHPRCPYGKAVCREKLPLYQEVAPGRYVSCHFALTLSLRGLL